jgi:hypothetical protein
MAPAPHPPVEELAVWLSEELRDVPEDYDTGRQAMADALVGLLRCSPGEAEGLLDELERAGHLRYAAEARSIGGSPGAWIIYPSAAENPETSSGRPGSDAT